MVFRVGKLDRWASRFATKVIRPGVASAVAKRSKPPPEHDLVLYDFEASPWCRLVREYATILDLTLTVKPCPRETLLYGEGSFGPNSKYRLEAMNWHQNKIRGNTHIEDNLTFPLLVDQTKMLSTHNKTNQNETKDNVDEDNGVAVLTESYDILTHLWEYYGESVVRRNPRPDQKLNNPSNTFSSRFFSLAGPSYLRPMPRCGLLRFPSSNHLQENNRLILYQSEGCPESRLVREALCCLTVSYNSVPVAEGSYNRLPIPGRIPILSIQSSDSLQHFVGADDCLKYLNNIYWNNFATTKKQPTWFDPLPKENVGRSGGPNFSVFTAALAALRKGNSAFVPDKAMQ